MLIPLCLFPLPHPLSFPQPRVSTTARTVLTKIKVEPVNLEPLLPQTKRDEVQAAQKNIQLPTPPLVRNDVRGRDRNLQFQNTKTARPLSFDAIERGGEREPSPRRFHRRTRLWMTPYDSESRPRATCQRIQTIAQKTNLNDIAAAAAAAAVDRLPQSTGSPHMLSSHLVPPSVAATPSLQQDRSVPTPHHHHHGHIHQQPTHDQDHSHLHSKRANDTSRAIDDAVDGMIKLCSCDDQTQTAHKRDDTETEMQVHRRLSSERQQCQKLYTDMQRERSMLALLNLQVQRDKGRLQRERQKLRGQVEKEIFAEKHELKARIERLEAMIFRRGRG